MTGDRIKVDEVFKFNKSFWDKLGADIITRIKNDAKQRQTLQNPDGNTKHSYTSPNYIERRRRKGLQTNSVDMYFEGDLLNSLRVTDSGNDDDGHFLQIEFTDDNAHNKLKYNAEAPYNRILNNLNPKNLKWVTNRFKKEFSTKFKRKYARSKIVIETS